MQLHRLHLIKEAACFMPVRCSILHKHLRLQKGSLSCRSMVQAIRRTCAIFEGAATKKHESGTAYLIVDHVHRSVEINAADGTI